MPISKTLSSLVRFLLYIVVIFDYFARMRDPRKHTAVNHKKCIGCGTCAGQCPKYYMVNEEEMLAYVQTGAEETVDNLQETIDTCPVGAISWQDS